MITDRRLTIHGPRTRRGVTLVEMLVTVAVLVIMMTILVQIFQAATGSVSAAQAYQQLDDQLRRLDGILRGDLEGVTARFTPPLDPAQNLGYFEYGENDYADLQGEDCDDYIRFTAKAPAGRPFTGRFWPGPWVNANGQAFGAIPPGQNTPGNLSSFPITITSDYAEIIYFVRNGNLYRRVLLVAPQLQSSVFPTVNNTAVTLNNTTVTFQPTILGQQVSWLGVNDLSARPAATGPNTNTASAPLAQAQNTIVLNTLGDLSNRENRAFYPRFANDFFNADPSQNMGATQPDGIPDDQNQDNVPDLYPSLYPGLFPQQGVGGTGPPSDTVNGGNKQLIFEPNFGGWSRTGLGFMAFPFVFPGAYSKAQALANDRLGWIHAPAPFAIDATLPTPNQYRFDQNPLQYLQNLNHNPLDVGDNLPAPPNALQGGGSDWQTWWGFPTWRETLTPAWNDPTVQVNVGPVLLASNNGATNPQTPQGLTYASLNITGGVLANASGDANLLPPMAQPGNFNGDFSVYRRTQQLFSDAAGQGSAFWSGTSATLWPLSWEDDLIMTGVRSFDVKAYDTALSNYADLGWGDDFRVSNLNLPFLSGNPDYSPQWTNGNPVYPPQVLLQNNRVDYINQTFAHEGRMPPLVADNRLDAQNPNPTYVNPSTYVAQYSANFPAYSSNIGDDNNGIVRLRRVWDSWSTDYSRAPASGVGPSATGGFPVGPPYSPPIYPSYPPPYPAPLRGIQIQIRVVDPTNQRIKSLTIRQDFTDKL
jgi:prepilin-type N-terminal cleavage/methylation domain-containing protein